MTPSTLGLETASQTQGFADIIPADTVVTLVTQIRPGNTGIENLLKRTAAGNALMLDVVFTVLEGPFDKRKIYGNFVFEGMTSGHGKAGEISRAFFRAVFEAQHGIDPNNSTPATIARRANATLAGFHGATFLAKVGIQKGTQKPDGTFYRDKNIVAKVLRPGDTGYQKLDQPPPMPIERSGPMGAMFETPTPTSASTVPAITKPTWA
jgi:hypothetical protein